MYAARLSSAAIFTVVASALAIADVSQPSIPLRRLSAPTHSTKEPLGVLLGVNPLSNGRVLLNDAGNRRLLLFDSTLSTFATLADTAGAGVFRYGNGASPIIPYLADTTLFVDRASQGFVVLDPEGRNVRIAALPKASDLPFIGGSRTIVDPQGRLIYRGTPRITPLRDTGQTVVVNRLADSAPIVRADFDTRQVDTLERVKLPSTQENHRHRQSDGSSYVRVVMFGLSWVDDWTVTSDGRIAVVRGHDYHVDWVNTDASRSSTGRLPFDWRALQDAEQLRIADSAAKETQQFIDSVRANPPAPRADGTRPIHIAVRFDIGAGGVQIMPVDAIAEPAPVDRIPDFQPPIRAGSVSADRNGNVWILPAESSRARGGGIVYDVVSAQGQLVERVEMLPGRSIVAFGPGDVVYTMFKDADDAWHVERARILR